MASTTATAVPQAAASSGNTGGRTDGNLERTALLLSGGPAAPAGQLAALRRTAERA